MRYKISSFQGKYYLDIYSESDFRMSCQGNFMLSRYYGSKNVAYENNIEIIPARRSYFPNGTITIIYENERCFKKITL